MSTYRISLIKEIMRVFLLGLVKCQYQCPQVIVLNVTQQTPVIKVTTVAFPQEQSHESATTALDNVTNKNHRNSLFFFSNTLLIVFFDKERNVQVRLSSETVFTTCRVQELFILP